MSTALFSDPLRKSMKCPPGAKSTKREPKTVRFTARVTAAVAEAQKESGQNWSAWILFLTENYRRSNFRSPALDPTTRRLLVWSSRALDEIAASVTGYASNGNGSGVEQIQRYADILSVLDEITRVRMVLQATFAQPVTAKGGDSDGSL